MAALRYIVDWRLHAATRLDDRRPVTLSAMARTAEGARTAALAAVVLAIDGEVRISVAAGSTHGRRAPVHCREDELRAWRPDVEVMPAPTRGSVWARMTVAEGARARFGTRLREAVRDAVAARLIDRRAGYRLVAIGDDALEGRGAAVD